MTPKQKVLNLVKSINAEISVDRTIDQYDIEVTAPKGFYWIDGDVHILVANKYYTDDFPIKILWKDLFERMKEGFSPCYSNCEFWEV